MVAIARPPAKRAMLDAAVRRRIFSAMRALAALTLLPLLASSPAMAGNVEAGYSMRWMGIEIGRLEIELRTTPTDYRLAFGARTTGALAWFVGFASEGSALGRLTPEGPHATLYRGSSAWDEGESHWQVGFAPDGEVTELVLDEASRADREPVPAELMKGPDPFTLALGALLDATAGSRLEGRSFDGKRAMGFTMDCAPAPEPVDPAALPGPRGGALLCSADGELLAGRSKRWGDDVDRENAGRRPARLWLLPGIGGLPHWPVRIEAESRMGTVTIELDRLVDPGA